MCPVIEELRKHKDFETIVAVTGQHREMLDQVLNAFSIEPDYDLQIMRERQDLFSITTAVLEGMSTLFEKVKPNIVVVHGDTTTSFATSLAAFYKGIMVAHVEAGLRTYNKYSPYPEEFNRQAVGILSSFNFAPTETAKNNLINEGKKESSIWVTGNTIVDALKKTVKNDYSHPELEWCEGKRMILITAHRRENLGEPMRGIFRAIKRVIDEHDDVRAVYPVHLNPKVRDVCYEVMGGDDRIHLIEPLDVFDFHNFINAAYLVVTDSGGIQEEAPSLGKPVLVLRNTTERPEGIEKGVVRLIGTDEKSVYAELSKLIDNKNEYDKMVRIDSIYGDGFASKRIVDVLAGYLREND